MSAQVLIVKPFKVLNPLVALLGVNRQCKDKQHSYDMVNNYFICLSYNKILVSLFFFYQSQIL